MNCKSKVNVEEGAIEEFNSEKNNYKIQKINITQDLLRNQDLKVLTCLAFKVADI